MRIGLVHDALQMALVRTRPAAGDIFRSDRGAQYTSKDSRKFCTDHGVRPSVGATGSCFDNAVAESFFATIKKELIHLRSWDSVTTVKTAVFDYIERYYNRRRRHSTFNYLAPAEYNAKFDKKNAICRKTFTTPKWQHSNLQRRRKNIKTSSRSSFSLRRRAPGHAPIVSQPQER